MTARPAFTPRPSHIALALATLLTATAHAAKPVTWEDIANDHKTTGDVLSYGLGLTAQRYSPARHARRVPSDTARRPTAVTPLARR